MESNSVINEISLEAETDITLIINSCGVIFEISVKPDAYIEEVKKVIGKKIRDSFDNRLGYSSRISSSTVMHLEACRTLKYYNIKDGDTLTIRFRLDRNFTLDELKNMDKSDMISVIIQDLAGKQFVLRFFPDDKIEELSRMIYYSAKEGVYFAVRQIGKEARESRLNKIIYQMKMSSHPILSCPIKFMDQVLESSKTLRDYGIGYGSTVILQCELHKIFEGYEFANLFETTFYPHEGDNVTLDVDVLDNNDPYKKLEEFKVYVNLELKLRAFKKNILSKYISLDVISSCEFKCGDREINDEDKTLKELGISNAFCIKLSCPSKYLTNTAINKKALSAYPINNI